MTSRQWNIICRFMYIVLYTMIAQNMCGGDGVGTLLEDIKAEGKLSVSVGR